MQFQFLLLHGAVCVKGSHRVNNGKQRATICWTASLYKNKLAQVSDTIEACYHNRLI